jgi:hypothetical protein
MARRRTRPEPPPDNLRISQQAPPPVTADVGIPFTVPSDPGVAHPLVTVGDSLTQGFQHLAVANTDRSWPALLAGALGISDFRHPVFDGPAACPGLPLNLEALLREADTITGGRGLPAHVVRLVPALFGRLWRIRTYWEFGPGRQPPPAGPYHHNLGTLAWDVRDAMSASAGWCQDWIARHPPRRDPRHLVISNSEQIAGLRTLTGPGGPATTQMSAARAMGEDGIGTLVVALGANNALASVITFQLIWSGPGFDDVDAKREAGYTVWRPEHFAAEYAALADEIEKVGANHVILATVPHVTVVPLARGVGEKPTGSRYFARYVRAFVADDQVDGVDVVLTGEQCRWIDSAIDMYNETIVGHARRARERGLDWRVFDLCALLDRLAYRRYRRDPTARPDWWSEHGPYRLPHPLSDLHPPPDTRFPLADAAGLTQGGLIGLDGVHPTTIGYAVMAHEVLKIMRAAGVPAAQGATVDFAAALARDTLVSDPPGLIGSDFRSIGWLVNRYQGIGRLLEAL